MKVLNVIYVFVLLITTSCYTINKINIFNNDYYENLLKGPVGGYFMDICIEQNNSLVEIIISYDELFDALGTMKIKKQNQDNKIFKAVKYHKTITVIDTFNYLYVIKSKRVDSLMKNGFEYFKNYFVEDDILNLNKIKENEIGYILSIFIKNKFYTYEDENGSIIISKNQL